MSRRITQLDGLRGIAILSVMLHHAFHVKLLWAGVDLFFVLSGFLITGILMGNKDKSLREYLGHFYSRRARRILPPYTLLIVITTVIYGFAWMHRWYLYIFLMNFLTAFQAGYPGTLNVLWSLAVEEQFYLVWPFVIFLASEVAVGWFAALLILVAPLLRFVATPYFALTWPVYMLTPFRMDLLSAGALLAVLWKRHPQKIQKYGPFGPIASVLAIAALVWFSRDPNFSTHANTRASNTGIYELTLVACTGIMLWALSGRSVGALNWRPLTYVGRISYSMYLIHTTMLFLAARYLGDHLSSTLIALAATFGYAALSWHFFEIKLLYGPPKDHKRLEAREDQAAITAPLEARTETVTAPVD